jgi:phage baseplate assembly protein W
MSNVASPWQLDARGRTADATDEPHILQMIEAVLFTNPGERVNQPDFGSGLRQLIFAPNSPELAVTAQYTLQAALQRYLGDVVALDALTIDSEDDELVVLVSYHVRASGQPASAKFAVNA